MFNINISLEFLLEELSHNRIDDSIIKQIKFQEFDELVYNYVKLNEERFVKENGVDYIYEIMDIMIKTTNSLNNHDFLNNHFKDIKRYPIIFVLDALSVTLKKYWQNVHDDVFDYMLDNYYFYDEKDLENKKIIYDQLKGYIECDKLNEFAANVIFIEKLFEFEDIEYLEDNYSNTNVSIDELIKVIQTGNVNSLDKLDTFISILKWNLPNNNGFLPYKKLNALKVFESKEDWSNNELKLWSDNFYYIDFKYDSAFDIENSISNTIKAESKHISEMNKKFPNYRHD